MTGQRPLAVIHTRHGATGLEAPNHQSHRRMWLLVALPCSVLETKESADGFQFFGGFCCYFPCGSFELVKLISSRRFWLGVLCQNSKLSQLTNLTFFRRCSLHLLICRRRGCFSLLSLSFPLRRPGCPHLSPGHKQGDISLLIYLCVATCGAVGRAKHSVWGHNVIVHALYSQSACQYTTIYIHGSRQCFTMLAAWLHFPCHLYSFSYPSIHPIYR